MGWIRSVDRQALHRPHRSLAVHLKYKKNLPDAGLTFVLVSSVDLRVHKRLLDKEAGLL